MILSRGFACFGIAPPGKLVIHPEGLETVIPGDGETEASPKPVNRLQRNTANVM